VGGTCASGGIREMFCSLPGSYSGARPKENPRISALTTAIMPTETTPAIIISTTISRLPCSRRGPLTGEVSTANAVIIARSLPPGINQTTDLRTLKFTVGQPREMLIGYWYSASPASSEAAKRRLDMRLDLEWCRQ
jgi:hypothetical protein